MGEAEKVDLEEFRRNIAAINREDWEAGQTLHHEDMVWHDAPELPDSTAHVGREAIRRYWEEELFDAWERWSLDLRELTPHGDFIFSYCILTAKARHSGIEQSIDVYQVWKVKDGLAIEQWLFFNREQAFQVARIDS